MSMVKNLLEETEDVLIQNGKQKEDVLWVGMEYEFAIGAPQGPKSKTTWDDFASKAADIRVPANVWGVIIVGKDFWMERHDSEGYEWWEFKQFPKEPDITRPLEGSDMN